MGRRLVAWIDPRIWCHPKFADLSDSACWLYVKGVAYCDGFSTKGHLSLGQVRTIGGTPKYRSELVDAGLWDEQADGFYVHDWEHHNGPRDRRKEEARERMRAHRAANSSANKDANSAENRSANRSALKSEEVKSEEEPKPLGAAPRKRDLVWEALTRHFGDPLTPGERKRLNGVRGQLRAAAATPEQVDSAVKAWGSMYPDARLTDVALAKHWTALVRQSVQSDPLARLAERARQREEAA